MLNKTNDEWVISQPEFKEKNGDNADCMEIDEPDNDEVRVYDVYITYDKYYLTPRLWLSAKSEDGD